MCACECVFIFGRERGGKMGFILHHYSLRNVQNGETSWIETDPCPLKSRSLKAACSALRDTINAQH